MLEKSLAQECVAFAHMACSHTYKDKSPVDSQTYVIASAIEIISAIHSDRYGVHFGPAVGRAGLGQVP